MTYADKYALMKMYKISTGDDPDADPSNDEYYRKPTDRKPPVQHDAKPKDELVCRCEKCNHLLTIYYDDNGKPISLRKWVEGSKKKFGMVLCKSCAAAVNTNEDK